MQIHHFPGNREKKGKKRFCSSVTQYFKLNRVRGRVWKFQVMKVDLRWISRLLSWSAQFGQSASLTGHSSNFFKLTPIKVIERNEWTFIPIACHTFLLDKNYYDFYVVRNNERCESGRENLFCFSCPILFNNLLERRKRGNLNTPNQIGRWICVRKSVQQILFFACLPSCFR